MTAPFLNNTPVRVHVFNEPDPRTGDLVTLRNPTFCYFTFHMYAKNDPVFIIKETEFSYKCLTALGLTEFSKSMRLA